MDHYYALLDSAIKDQEVDKAFYSYTLEYVKLNPDFDERKIPMTKTKLMMINRDNNKVHEFIKEKYIIQNRDLNESSSILYHNFKTWFATYVSSNKKPPTIQEFTRALEKLGIKAKQKRVGDRKANKKLQWYSVPYADLYTIFMKKNMIDEAENIEVPEGYKESEVLIEIPPERLPNTVCEQEEVMDSQSEQEETEDQPVALESVKNLIDNFITELNTLIPPSVKSEQEPEVEQELEQESEIEPEPYRISGPSIPAKLTISQEVSKPVQKVDSDPMPKMNTAKYWE
ncbi:hypothetical protein RCL_e4482_RclHR1_10470004 [Rhizophagus clarus]|uniref:Uncharacterized protein n=1 Tax=Rhizophagus clarus TaxID=94130 RepID=A0A8H3M2V6_9GLOM|nr:hypothetical protein RCL_e4482_RclHR1_10470004 [Rhizophagus clarus]